MRLVVTGVPGTGKTTLAPQLARMLNSELIDINKFAKQRGLGKKGKGPELEVDIGKLEKVLRAHLKSKKEWVVEGHLACEIALPATRVLVLRCKPSALRQRLKARGYPAAKIEENVLAETLDYCLLKAEGNYKRARVLQLDFTKPKTAIDTLKRVKIGRTDRVAWTKELFEAAATQLKAGHARSKAF